MPRPVGFHRRSSFLLATLGRRTESAWGTFLHGTGWSNAEFAALAVLVGGPAGQGELASYLGIDPRNAGALVGRLRRRGWVEVVADPADGRRRIITVTAAGRAAWDDVQRPLADARRDYFAALTPAEQQELQRLLNKLNDAHLAHPRATDARLGTSRGGSRHP